MNISSTSGFTRPDPAELFKRADTDGSGSISKDELKTMFENGPQPPPGGAPPDSQTSGVSQTSSTDATSKLDKIFASMDSDGDGQISQAEFKTAMQQMQQSHGHHHHRTGGFSGSSDTLNSILDTLQKQDSGDSSSTLTSDQRKVLEQLINEVKNNGMYTAQGNSGTTSVPNLFGTTA